MQYADEGSFLSEFNCLKRLSVGAWRSLVAHLFWVQGVVSSNLAAPTTSLTDIRFLLLYAETVLFGAFGSGRRWVFIIFTTFNNYISNITRQPYVSCKF